jgi:branched-chain amino acid transport system permease protein
LFAPTGLAGLILRHEPVWKTDVRLLGKMVLPYLGALITLLIAACGIIALIEMIAFFTDEYSVGTIANIYGIKVETTSILPWVAFSIIAFIGIILCRLTFPFVTRNWDDIMDTVKERMLR